MANRRPISAQLLRGRTAYVIFAGSDSGSQVVAGLQAQGARTALVSEQFDPIADISITAGVASRAAVSRAFARAVEHIGPPDLTVICIGPSSTRQPCSLDQYTDEDWTTKCQAPLKSTLFCLQEAATAMAGRGGAVVLLGPTVGYTGAKELVALCTLTEGQRGLVKSAARQLGVKGITVNWLALASTALYPDLRKVRLPQVPEMGPPPLPLGRAPALGQVVSVLAFLGSTGGRVVTGASLTADGGEWMLP